jgi:hypothetical protein
VAIKIFKNEFMSRQKEDYISYNSDLSLIKKVNHPHIENIIDFDRWCLFSRGSLTNSYYIIMIYEDKGAFISGKFGEKK